MAFSPPPPPPPKVLPGDCQCDFDFAFAGTEARGAELSALDPRTRPGRAKGSASDSFLDLEQMLPIIILELAGIERLRGGDVI